MLMTDVYRQAEEEPRQGVPGYGQDEGCCEQEEMRGQVSAAGTNGWIVHFSTALLCCSRSYISRCGDCNGLAFILRV